MKVYLLWENNMRDSQLFGVYRTEETANKLRDELLEKIKELRGTYYTVEEVEAEE